MFYKLKYGTADQIVRTHRGKWGVCRNGKWRTLSSAELVFELAQADADAMATTAYEVWQTAQEVRKRDEKLRKIAQMTSQMDL